VPNSKKFFIFVVAPTNLLKKKANNQLFNNIKQKSGAAPLSPKGEATLILQALGLQIRVNW